MNILDLLGKRTVFFDGAMGTMLQNEGLEPGDKPELWNLNRPDIIKSIHSRYVQAGADIIKSNTFGANSVKLKGCGYTAGQVIGAGVALAKSAAAGRAVVAMDIGPTGKAAFPMGDLSFEDAYASFAEAAVAGEKAGADIVLIETMSDTYELKAAVLAAKEKTDLPVFATVVVDENGRMLNGADIPAAVALLEGLRVDALGLNCGFGPDKMLSLLPGLIEHCSTPVIMNPNAGLPHEDNGRPEYGVTPAMFSKTVAEIASGGASIVGGCCGTTPEYIKMTVSACRGITPKPLKKHCRTVVSSYSKCMEFGKRPLIIGERINPSGKPRLRQALRDGNMEYVLREAITQQQNGADILDVNVGLPEIDEASVLCRAVTQIQSVCDLPLQIDTSDYEAMKRAMRIYNGKPLINSVSGKKESMDAVFPLVKKYGGAVIALTLDDDGIPDTAEGRLAIAGKIIAEAERYGIPQSDIIVDTLVMTISAGQENAMTTLRAHALVKKKLCAMTSLGVSNVSFGLPNRGGINAAFFTMALSQGLNAAIINPNSEGMMTAYRAFCAISGHDKKCMGYIGHYASRPAHEKLPAVKARALGSCIENGLREDAKYAAADLLKTKSALDIINSELIPALDRVGKGYGDGVIFLPQLLMSADAATAAFDEIRKSMLTTGGIDKKEKIVLATVRGDIHDIGKNIVKVLLQNYGYDVIDLGRDVPAEIVLESAKGKDVRLVGLSALMTTTVVSMEKTIKLLHKNLPGCKVMVGGAVLNPEYAKMIGADFYGENAMDSVNYAQRLFGYIQADR